jgi:GNAT superfamily N-acetyltransferase
MSAREHVEVVRVPLDAIIDMRDEYRREMACQIVHDSWHARGFTDSYLLRVRGEVVGYGAVGGAPRDARDTLKEFYVRPEHRGDALPLFRRLVAESGARTVEAQTNDVLLSRMLHDSATGITSETILFADGATTSLAPPAPDATVRRLGEAERASAFVHTREPVGEWGLHAGGELVATGGLAFHYNPPYGDIYMEVDAAHRRRGFGSFLVQELKRVCGEMGCIPAARCHQDNVPSRLTLQRAGMYPCARIVHGRLAGMHRLPVDWPPAP